MYRGAFLNLNLNIIIRNWSSIKQRNRIFRFVETQLLMLALHSPIIVTIIIIIEKSTRHIMINALREIRI